MQMVYWLAFVVYRGAPRPTWDMGGSWNPDGRWDHGDHLISDFLPRYLGPGQGHGDLDREELLLVVARLPDGGHTQGRVPEVVLEAGLAADAATAHQHMRTATTRGLPQLPPHPHAPQCVFINGFFIAARSLSVQSPLLVRQAQWQWRSTREGRACKRRGERSFSEGKKGYAAARGDPDASPPTPALK